MEKKIKVTVSTTIKKNRYYAVLYYKDSNNNKHRKTIRTGLTTICSKKELNEKIESIRSNFEENLNSQIENAINTVYGLDFTSATQNLADISFTDFLKNWLEIMKPQLKGVTYSGYCYKINKICEYFSKSNPTLKSLKPLDIQNFYNSLLSSGISANTIKRYHANIKKALNYALKMELVYRNVANFVELPKVTQYIPKILDLDEIQKLINSLECSKYKLPILLGVFYGLRREEVIGLKWDAINFNQDTITICHTVVPKNENGKHILEKSDSTKTASSHRVLPLFTNVKIALLEEQNKQNKNKEFFGNTWKNQEGYVCVREDGKLIHPETLTDNFQKILSDNDIKKVRFHDLRHSIASLLLNYSQLDMKYIQSWLGHSNYNTTANIYAHLNNSSNDVTASKIEAMLNPSIKQDN